MHTVYASVTSCKHTLVYKHIFINKHTFVCKHILIYMHTLKRKHTLVCMHTLTKNIRCNYKYIIEIKNEKKIVLLRYLTGDTSGPARPPQ